MLFFTQIFHAKNEKFWFWGIGLLAVFVEVCFHALLPISISNDSYGYLAISQHLGDPKLAFERSVGYPIFLYLLGTHLFDSLMMVILVQAALAICVPLLVFKSLIRAGLSYAVLGGLISCVYFYNFIVSLYVLTDPVYVFSIAVYTFCLIKYFYNRTWRNLLFCIASCWLIALIRVDGTQYFLALLLGITVGCMSKRSEKIKLRSYHVAVAIAVFMTISFVQKSLTNRTSLVIWPHFVFNWAYKANIHNCNLYYGIIKPENGPAARKLFHEVRKIVADNPSAFNVLKGGGAEKVRSLVPEANGKYSEVSVDLLMDDLINNNVHDTRSWWIMGMLKDDPSFGVVGSSKIVAAAIVEAFKKHPEALVTRMSVVWGNYWNFMKNGIVQNNIMFSTAYHQQVNVNPLPLGLYKQWVYDLYQHTGKDAIYREFDYPNKFPRSLQGAVENIQSDNLIGLGHYVGGLGTQIIRLCWLFVGLGILLFPFTKQKPLLASLLYASIVPPFLSVFISEVDTRHFLMVSPVQIVTAVFVVYLLISTFDYKTKSVGNSHAK